MREKIKFVQRRPAKDFDAKLFGVETSERTAAFHESFPEYEPTPLVRLRELAAAVGVADISVKDESFRFGLNAFKALGGSYAIGHCIAERLGMDMNEMTCEKLTGASVRERLGGVTFVTATDGNHGRGVAWTARRLGQKSVVYMPKGTAAERLENIRALGADASITDMNYDDTVRFARKMAEANGWLLVQDTSMEGYEEMPVWIMQGYATMGYEISRQLDAMPTHVFLQAGVGAMAGAMSAFFADWCGDALPSITIVEPTGADCVFLTAEADDGHLHAAPGPMDTMMAGLSCGEVCGVAWKALRSCAENFVSIPDSVAAKGMRVLGNPLGRDGRVVSGESGASAFGFAAEALMNPELADIRETLGLGRSSRILCISTEGDTDRANYRRVVWDGECQSL